MANPIELSTDMQRLADGILSNGIDADEVLRLRREVFADGVADRDEVRLLFHLNEACARGNDPAWYEFFVEALAQYFVWRQQPPGYVSDEDAQFLVDLVDHDGRIDSRTEFALLVTILNKLRLAPEELVVLTLEGVRQTVLGGGGALFGSGRRQLGVIDAADVDVIRSVVFASGSGGSLTITRREAELMFELNDRTAEKRNAPEWQRLFVEVVAHYLMFPRGAPEVPDREEAARRERWLKERRGLAGMAGGMLNTLLNPDMFGAAAGDIVFGDKREREARERAEREAEAEAFARRSIDAAEAAWLLERIEKDGIVHDNEKALLAFIKRNSPSVHASLEPVLERAGVG